MISYRPLVTKDLYMLEPAPIYGIVGENVSDRIKTCLDQGGAGSVVLEVRGIPVAVVGADPISDSTVEIWAITTKSLPRFQVAATKELKKLIANLGEDLGIQRAHAMVDSDFSSGKRWLSIMGFTYECTMRKFNNGRDVDVYARFY